MVCMRCWQSGAAGKGDCFSCESERANPQIAIDKCQTRSDKGDTSGPGSAPTADLAERIKTKAQSPISAISAGKNHDIAIYDLSV